MKRRWLAGEALLWMLGARVALRWVPVRRILAYAGEGPRRPRPEDMEARTAIREIRWAVMAVTRHAPVELVCFPQCLAAMSMLRRRGIASRLHYGAARLEGKLQTHTWLEAEGVTVIGGEVADSFSLLATYQG